MAPNTEIRILHCINPLMSKAPLSPHPLLTAPPEYMRVWGTFQIQTIIDIFVCSGQSELLEWNWPVRHGQKGRTDLPQSHRTPVSGLQSCRGLSNLIHEAQILLPRALLTCKLLKILRKDAGKLSWDRC